MIESNKHFKTVEAAFPKISKKIKLFWGHYDFVELMFELQSDTRDHNRAGFPLKVLAALHELDEQHRAEFPALVRKPKNVWEVNLR